MGALGWTAFVVALVAFVSNLIALGSDAWISFEILGVEYKSGLWRGCQDGDC